MRRALPCLSFSTILLCLTITTRAQNDRFAYAITDKTQEGSNWIALRRLDLQTGAYSAVLLEGNNPKAIAYDAATNQPLEGLKDERSGSIQQQPFGTGVAAAAYDRKHNRLYFTPMFVDQLRYIDLRTMKLYYVTGQPFSGLGTMHNSEGKVVTRMVITPDGKGYAVSNDGKTFVQFTTGKKHEITQLGSLQDDEANNGISIHSRAHGYGGDMVADEEGNLYIITARNHVFKIDVATKAARHLGAIEGLPDDFTVNGAVVNAAGALLVSSAVAGNAYYVVDTKGWKATPFALASSVYRSSDLANSNFLKTGKTTTIATMAPKETLPGNALQLYPNPVTHRQFTLQFNNLPLGDYTAVITAVNGKILQQEKVTIGAKSGTQVIALPPAVAKGTYLLRLVNKSNQSLYEQKVAVQ